MTEPLVQVKIDDRMVAVPRGTNLIEAAKSAGIDIPHYCYHRKLSVAGNCRMCLVEVGTPKLGADRKPELDAAGQPVIAFMPKLQIACNTQVSEGMAVRTGSEKVVKARAGVMEFLLANHPLDCPICDQAGECRLQEFAVDHGRGGSRFAEEKVHKPKQVSLGPKITLDVERCIMCSRCERFMREVAGQDCLGFMRRGSLTELSCYPGEWPDTNYDLNIVDICPVGALTSNDFRFRMRPWFLKETRSICPHCANGCNMLIGARGDTVYRLTPRDNEAVNGSWMCDQGRLNYRFVNDPARLQAPSLRGQPATWQEALAEAVRLLQGAAGSPGAAAVIGSARCTTEELFLLRRLAREGLHAELTDVVPRSGAADALLLKADRNPNTAGAILTGLAADPPGTNLARIADGIRAGRIRALLVWGEDAAACGLDVQLLGRLDALVVADILPSATTAAAHVLLPAASFAEKSGTYLNGRGRLQRLLPAIAPPGDAREDWSTLAALLRGLGVPAPYAAWGDVFADLVRTHAALSGITWQGLGDLGMDVDLKSGDAVTTEGQS